jgi:hypothetical protein
MVGLKKPCPASGRTVLLVEVGVNLVGHLREKGQVLPRKTLGTFPRLSILVEGGELDLVWSVFTVVEDGGLFPLAIDLQSLGIALAIPYAMHHASTCPTVPSNLTCPREITHDPTINQYQLQTAEVLQPRRGTRLASVTLFASGPYSPVPPT